LAHSCMIDEDLTPNVDHEAAAFHEAGHALVLYHLMPVARILQVEATGAEAGDGFTIHQPWLEDRGPYYHAWQLLAGRAAEWLLSFHHYSVDLEPFDECKGLTEDYEEAHGLLLPGAPLPEWRDVSRSQRMVRELNKMIEWLHVRWDQIVVLADALIREGRLLGDDVVRTLSAFGPPHDCRRLHAYAVNDPYGIVPGYWRTRRLKAKRLRSVGCAKRSSSSRSAT
jgi:hypothetical protein